MKKKRKGIRKKILSSFITVLALTIVISFAFTQISVFILKSKNENQLIEQAIDSAKIYTEGQADTIAEQLSGIISKINQSAQFAEYIYKNPKSFGDRKILTPDDFDESVTGNQIHWLPFEKEDLNNPDVIAEANLLMGLEPEFKSLLDTCPMIVSIYVATNTHVNIGYDKNVLSKQGIGAYNPETADAKWYTETIGTGKTYISDVYSDTFNRGSMITITTPYSVDGKLRGIIGADIIIENINKFVLDIDVENHSGYAMLFSENGTPISAKGITEKTTAINLLGTEDAVKEIQTKENSSIESVIDGKDTYVVFDTIKETGWKLAIVLSIDSILEPAMEANRLIIIIDILITILNIILLAGMLIAVNKLAHNLTRPITSLTEDVEKIGGGNLDYKSSIDTGDEIQTLSESFEQMTNSLNEHIKNLTEVTAENERIGTELNVATHIQASMLPCIFPAFPNRDEFDIFATMTPAKEVGGDFYDFFMVDDNHIAIVMADVSGKGVPAALFMVIAKTLIKDHTYPDANLGEVFTDVNRLLCESNSGELFVTAFEGVIDIVTGEFRYVNAGHEMPFICKKGEKYKPFKIRPGFVLAGMEGMKYKEGSLMLEPGDKIFQYTDGVTEATDINNKLYGMERLEKALGDNTDKSVSELLPAIKEDIDKFTGDAPQFDDITMLCFEYKKKGTAKSIENIT